MRLNKEKREDWIKIAWTIIESKDLNHDNEEVSILPNTLH